VPRGIVLGPGIPEPDHDFHVRQKNEGSALASLGVA